MTNLAADSVRAFLDAWPVQASKGVIASVDAGEKIGETILDLTVSALEDLLEQVATTQEIQPADGYASLTVPTGEAFVILGWGDTNGGYPQTLSTFYDGAKPDQRWHPTDLSPLQRRIAVMRLRYVADLIDPDKVWDI